MFGRTFKDNIKGIGLNLGSGNGFSVKEILQEVEEFTDEKIDVIYEDRRPDDSTKDMLKLDYDYSSLRDIIETL